MKIVEPDFDRRKRCGIPEVVYGEHKATDHLSEIVGEFLEKQGRAIVTKVSPEKAQVLSDKFSGHHCDYSRDAQVFVAKKEGYETEGHGVVGLITAGTSDIRVAEEARIILEQLGCSVVKGYDVGVAGIHRLFPVIEKMRDAGVLIVFAGMEGALPSVVSGLVDVPVLGVPTSVGYGVGAGGRTALNAMLTSCSPVAVVNIDNGYGAAVIAFQIMRKR